MGKRKDHTLHKLDKAFVQRMVDYMEGKLTKDEKDLFEQHCKLIVKDKEMNVRNKHENCSWSGNLVDKNEFKTDERTY